MRILLVGYGKMGQLVEQLAVSQGMEIASRIDVGSGDWSSPADVAIDFSTAGALKDNFPRYVERKLPAVIGTTGWSQHEGTLRASIEAAGVGVVAAPNFSTGVVLFEALVAYAAKLFGPQADFAAFLHEAHHSAKKDAPSGTAFLLKRAMEQSGYARPIDVSSTRAGFIPGTHTVGFDGPAETITLTHTARDRTAFARGALTAAKWIQGKRGWFTMRDVLGVGE